MANSYMRSVCVKYCISFLRSECMAMLAQCNVCFFVVFVSDMPSDAAARYCQGCARRHRSAHWYGFESFFYCLKTYARLFRAGWLVLHPCWDVFYNALHDVDETGCRIAAAAYRADVNAVVDSYAMLGMYPHWEPRRLVLCLFGAQLYFPWPMHDFIHGMGQCADGILTRRLLRDVGLPIFRRYGCMRVLDGRLVCSTSRGILVTKNPSERRDGIVRFLEMLSDLRGIIRICDAMTVYFNDNSVVSISDMLRILGDAECSVFGSAKAYKNIRCCRFLAAAAGRTFESNEADWRIFSTMSPHVSAVVTQLGLRDYKYALKFMRAIGTELRLTTYSINDLVIFSCLLNHEG